MQCDEEIIKVLRLGKSIILIRGFLYICTVVLEVPKPRMADAFSVLRDLKLPVNGYAMDIGLVEFSSVREVFSFVLGDNNVEY